MEHKGLKAAFLRDGDREAAPLFNDLIRTALREALWGMAAEGVDSLFHTNINVIPSVALLRKTVSAASLAVFEPGVTVNRTTLRAIRGGRQFRGGFERGWGVFMCVP
jgi:hypothetical protein